MVKIAICGLGTIGYGVYDIIKKNYLDIEVVKVFDKDKSKENLVGKIITTNLDEILNDDKIDTVVCTMGGLDFAYSVIKKSIEKKKNVVTANKEVVSRYFEELSILKEKNNVSFSFEASVGGGVPIIKNLIDVAKTNKITAIHGILNGTTNFILTKISEGMAFDEAFTLAREKGFAEADASYDLDGLDMLRKIAILTMIATNKKVDIDKIYHYSMSKIQKQDMEFVKEFGFNIKYLAYFVDGKIGVEPHLVTDAFKNIKDEYNLVSVMAENYGTLQFYGKGAGRYATANAIVTDIIDIKNNNNNYTFKKKDDLLIKEDNNKYVFFLRVKDKTKVNRNIIAAEKDNLILTKNIEKKDIDFNNVEFYAKAK